MVKKGDFRKTVFLGFLGKTVFSAILPYVQRRGFSKNGVSWGGVIPVRGGFGHLEDGRNWSPLSFRPDGGGIRYPVGFPSRTGLVPGPGPWPVTHTDGDIRRDGRSTKADCRVLVRRFCRTAGRFRKILRTGGGGEGFSLTVLVKQFCLGWWKFRKQKWVVGGTVLFG